MKRTSTRRAMVIGLADAGHGDEGVGAAAIWALRRLDVGGAALLTWRGEATRLCDRWRGADVVVLVDSAATSSSPGRVHRRSLWHPSAAASPLVGVHSRLVSDAVSLSAAFDLLPKVLLLYAVETAPGAIVSASVQSAIRGLAAEIAGDLAARGATRPRRPGPDLTGSLDPSTADKRP